MKAVVSWISLTLGSRRFLFVALLSLHTEKSIIAKKECWTKIQLCWGCM